MINTFTELEDFKMLQGGAIDLRIAFMDIVGATETPADLSDYTCWFVMYPSGQEDFPLFRKKCGLVAETTHEMSVSLLSEETKDWQGAYTFEFVLQDLNEEFIKNTRGVMHVLKSNSELM